MAVTTQYAAQTKEIFASSFEWYFREEARIPDDLPRYCKANALIEFTHGRASISFAILVSAGCSHIAAVEANASERKIKVTVYYLKDGFEEKWSVAYQAPESEFKSAGSFGSYDHGAIQGGVTEDGQSVLLVYRPKGCATRAYLVNARGFTWRNPPSETHLDYSSSVGIVSEDSEYLFYVRSATKFGRNGEAKAVEAYSIRHLSCVRAETFGFGDGRHMRNVKLLRHLHLQAPVYMAFDTTNFSGDDIERNSPPLIASSDGSLHWNFAGIDSITSSGANNCFVSPDNAHLFFVEPDCAMLHHWDLKRPSLKSLGCVRLPGVEYARYRTWLLHGRETRVKDAIKPQTHNVRYSPKCKIITVVTLTDSSVVINVLSTYNLQLIYHETVTRQANHWPQYVPLCIGFNEETGLNIVAMFPARVFGNDQGLLKLFGMKGILIPLPEVFKKIKAIEQYFDHVSDRIAALPESVASKEVTPVCKFGWKPGVMDRNDEFAMPLVHGQATVTNAEDAKRQSKFYASVYSHQSLSWRQDNTAELRRFFVPHLFSFTYPWAPKQRVSVFGVIMKNEYHIISIGPPASNPESDSDVVRVLYATDIKLANDEMEHIEIFKVDCQYVLRVYKMSSGFASYSGAPMPIPRWTVMSPHFLEEDAWYDTFVIHKGANVTMPGGWIATPNSAISFSTNFYAYFQQDTFVVQDEINYGLRTRSGYVMPKHLLWREYGLRGLRQSNPNDILFGGGRYADTLGPYFRSIYEDKTYDESNPLFPSTFAMACNSDYRAQKTTHVDAFFRRFRQDGNRLLENSVTITCALPLACKARPGATLSFMRYITLHPWRVNDIGAVQVKKGATSPTISNYDDKLSIWRRRVGNIWHFFLAVFATKTQVIEPEPNKTVVTLPLPGFCSFGNKLYKTPPVSDPGRTIRDDPFWEFVLATTPYDAAEFPMWGSWLATSVAHSGERPASPFTRLIEEILEMKIRDRQLSYLKVVWLEKLLAWKMHTFGLKIYLTRMALPMIVLFILHLTVAILLTGSDGGGRNRISWWVIVLASIEAVASCFILSVKVRQAYRIPRVFFRSIFHYVDATALSLGIAMFLQIVTNHLPSRAFLSFSTLLIWIAAVLMLRIHKPVGMLLLLLTETIQETFSFLVLLFFIILGFAFVPFLLLRNIEGTAPASNPFSSFPISFTNILTFISSDYSALQPFQDTSAAVHTLQSLYIIIINVLLLNILIAMLNLKIKKADKNAANLYHLQMTSLQVEIELGLLSSSERASRHWFPQWFTYSMTERERRIWEDYTEKNKLKWDEENDIDESEEHAPPPASIAQPERQGSYAPVTDEKVAASTPTARDDSPATTPDREDALPPPQSTAPARVPETAESTTPTSAAGQGSKEQEPSASKGAAGSAEEESAHDEVVSREELACKICGSPGKRCKRCKLVAYCGIEHQKQDWKAHKPVCKEG